jgi:hypothetical protein
MTLSHTSISGVPLKFDEKSRLFLATWLDRRAKVAAGCSGTAPPKLSEVTSRRATGPTRCEALAPAKQMTVATEGSGSDELLFGRRPTPRHGCRGKSPPGGMDAAAMDGRTTVGRTRRRRAGGGHVKPEERAGSERPAPGMDARKKLPRHDAEDR